MGGSDDEDNNTQLTAREHYLAHRLLTKMYPNQHKLLHAFAMMSVKSGKQVREYTSRQYESMKIARSKAMSINNPSSTPEGRKRLSELATKRSRAGFNPMNSPKARAVHSERMKRNNPNKGGATNPRAKAIRVTYDDDSVVEYDYGKQFSEQEQISYPTVKALIRSGKGSKKYQIRSIQQLCHN